MATVRGTSGAWKPIAARLRDDGIYISHPREIPRELDDIKKTYDQRVARLFVDVGNEIAAFQQQVAATAQDVSSRIDLKRSATAEEVARCEARLSGLQAAAGFFRRFANRLKIKMVEHQRDGAQQKLERDLASLGKIMLDMQNRLNKMKNNKSSMVDQRKEDLDLTIGRLEAILRSQELAGAQAEIEVIEKLSQLPPPYHVFNDMQLYAKHFMRFEGVPLQSAQVDHVVLAPFGVFVIETKNWSQQFVDEREHFDPFTQVGRSRFLCQILLRDAGCDTKVRSIIACKGKLPPKREDQYVKVLGIPELNGYITWFKDPPMAQERLEQVRRFLDMLVADSNQW